MPLGWIDVLRADPDRLQALGRAVHEALLQTIGIPPDDRFQILSNHGGIDSTLNYDGYFGIHRDDGIVYIGITMRAGRAPGQKHALYRRIAELAQAYAGTDPRNVFITVTENESADWSLGNGSRAVPRCRRAVDSRSRAFSGTCRRTGSEGSRHGDQP